MLLFALYRERAGKGKLLLELADGATVATAIDQVLALHPDLAPPTVKIVAAVNTNYVEDSYSLADGDEIALIPPVSGGH